MKRPFAVVGFTYLSALLTASYFETSVNAALGVFLLLCGLITLIAFRFAAGFRTAVLIFLTAAAALAAFCLADLLWYAPAASLSGQQGEIHGTITELPQQSGSVFYYLIKTDNVKIGDKTFNISTNIRLKTQSPIPAEPFDTITVNAQLYTPQSGNTGFDSRRYYRSKGIYLAANAISEVMVKQAVTHPPYYYAIRLRQYVSGVLKKYIGGTWGSLSSGILIGDVSQLPQGVRLDFTATGISHILAVSGTQTSLITQYVLLLLCALRLPKRVAAGFSAGSVLLFIAVTGFSPSVMRAGVMSLIFLAGLLIKREADMLNSLGISVFALCLFNPYAAADVGLLLSFSATLGMITLSKKMVDFAALKTQGLPPKLKRLLLGPIGLMCQTTGASLLTYPIIVLTFGQLSLVTLFSNMLEVPASLFVTLAAAVVVLFSPFQVLVFLIRPIAMLIRITTALMMWYAHALASLPFSTISAKYGFVYLFLLFAVIAGVVYLIFRNKGASLKICAACLCFTLACGMLSFSVATKGVLEIAAMPLSSGSCVVITFGGRALIFDISGSGAAYQAEQFLKSHNISSVDALILSDYDKQRVDNANALLNDIKINDIYIPGAYKSDENPVAVCVTNKAQILWQGIKISLLPSYNQRQIIAKLTYQNSSAVITGDTDADTVNYSLEANWLDNDLLFFGGGVTKGFAGQVSPQFAVQGGSPQAAYAGAILLNMGCRVRSEDEFGLLSVLTRGNGKYIFDNSF